MEGWRDRNGGIEETELGGLAWVWPGGLQGGVV